MARWPSAPGAPNQRRVWGHREAGGTMCLFFHKKKAHLFRWAFRFWLIYRRALEVQGVINVYHTTRDRVLILISHASELVEQWIFIGQVVGSDSDCSHCV